MLIRMDIARAYGKVNANQDEEQIETSAPHDDVPCLIRGVSLDAVNGTFLLPLPCPLTRGWSGGVLFGHESDALCALCLTLRF